MRYRTIRRATTLAAALALLVTSAAMADTLEADADRITPTADVTRHLGEFPPGAVVHVDMGFVLTCSGTSHVDRTQGINLELGPKSFPDGGDVTATSIQFPAPGPTWPLDGQSCPAGATPIVDGTTVTLTAPPEDGLNYPYVLMWDRTLDPSGTSDSSALRGFTLVTLQLDVVSNTPPVVTVPADFSVEGDTTGGWTGSWSVTATDAQDDPDPSPTCDPAAGTVLPLGTTTVSCSAQDSKGLSALSSFDVTVVDTSPPVLSNVPAPMLLVTADPAGTTISYAPPTATDVVDANPEVECDPAPGDFLPVGDTTVTCTATDGSGNSAEAAFPVTVELWTIEWLEPLSGSSPALDVQSGRTLPLKARAWRNGAEVTTGSAQVRVVSCAGGPAVVTAALSWTERWSGRLDTSGLDGGCYHAVLSFDGLDVGGFALAVRGTLNAVRGPASGN